MEKVIFNCGEFNELEQDLINVLDRKKIKYYSDDRIIARETRISLIQ